MDFKLRLIKTDKGSHYILLRGTILEEGIIIINIYATNISAPNSIKQTLTDMKIQINTSMIVLGISIFHSHK